jgi:hypothetical protein
MVNFSAMVDSAGSSGSVTTSYQTQKEGMTSHSLGNLWLFGLGSNGSVNTSYRKGNLLEKEGMTGHGLNCG